MSKTTKIWLITAISLILIGCIIIGYVMTELKWDFSKLSTVKFETNTYEANEEFSSISLNTDTADIIFMTSEDDNCTVICYELKNSKHSVTVQDGTLTINEVNGQKWYEYMGITIGSPKITVYLPHAEYDMLTIKETTGDIEIPKNFNFESIDIWANTGNINNYASVSDSIKIRTSTGDICVENISAGMLDLSVSTGKVIASSINCNGDIKISVTTGKTNLTDISCKNFSSTGNTGSISLKNVTSSEKLSIERSTGSVSFDGCDAAEFFVKTDTGDVTGSLLSEKIFFTQTDTGRVDVPQTTNGGRCEITTDTGDIKITVN